MPDAPARYFWRDKTLSEMTEREWELLCDGCAKCCVHKLQDEDSDKVVYTSVACRQLDLQSARCKNYPQRARLVPDCLVLQPSSLTDTQGLPSSCAYRLVAEGKDLPSWHPLVSGEKYSTLDAGQSVVGKLVSEKHVPLEALEEYIIHWIE